MFKKVSISIRVPEYLLTIIKDIAGKKGYTINSLILQIIWDWLKDNKHKD